MPLRGNLTYSDWHMYRVYKAGVHIPENQGIPGLYQPWHLWEFAGQQTLSHEHPHDHFITLICVQCICIKNAEFYGESIIVFILRFHEHGKSTKNDMSRNISVPFEDSYVDCKQENCDECQMDALRHEAEDEGPSGTTWKHKGLHEMVDELHSDHRIGWMIGSRWVRRPLLLIRL